MLQFMQEFVSRCTASESNHRSSIRIDCDLGCIAELNESVLICEDFKSLGEEEKGSGLIDWRFERNKET